MPPCAAQGCNMPDDAACAPSSADGAKALKPRNNVSGAAVGHAAGALGGAEGAASPPPPIKLEFSAVEPATKKPKVEAEGAAAAAPAPPAPPAVKLEDEDGHPAVKLEDEDADAAAPAPPFVPPPFVPVFVPPPPPLPPAASRLLGKVLGLNRGHQRATFHSIATDGISPHVVVCEQPPPDVAKFAIHASLSVAFPDPLVPTPPQMQVMSTLATALVERKHCIVEAPTGTGKTAAVFMPLLAFQAQQEQLHGASDPGRVPRIIYVARTLAQLDKSGQELAKYPYKVLLAAPVGKEHLCMLPKEEGTSRADQCRKACQPLSDLERYQMGNPYGRTTHCTFLDMQNQKQLPNSDIEEYFTGRTRAGSTVEEVKKHAAAEGICAYHVSRDLANTEGANVVMLTYSQLLDPHFRACNKTDALLKGALLFIDEAHNVPGVCRQVSSEALNWGNLVELRNETYLQNAWLETYLEGLSATLCRSEEEKEDLKFERAAVSEHINFLHTLELLIRSLMTWMLEQADLSAAPKRNAPFVDQWLWSEDGGTKQLANLPGTCAQDLVFTALATCGAMRYALPAAATDGAAPLLSPAAAAGVVSGNARPLQRAQDACAALKRMAKNLETIDIALSYANYIPSSEFARRQRTPTSRLATLLSKLEMCVGANADAFALVLRRLSPRGDELKRRNPQLQRHETLPALDIVCLTASLAMRRVLELAQCCVFASGTLGPHRDFALEVGLLHSAVGYRSVSTDHHATVQSQLLPLVYTGSSLRITTTTLALDHTLDEVGDVLLRCAPNVPGGILVFFGSKNASELFCKRWANGYVMQQLQQLLPDPAALVIDMAGTPEEAVENLKRFSDHAKKPSISGRPTAIMFSVLRGRSAEGADFKDSLARAVFVVGVPLAPWTDPFVVAKMAYNKSMDRNVTDGGERWYYSEAARCAAQAAGRVIRHAGDYGVVVLLDSRYTAEANGSVKQFLPRYLYNLLQNHSGAQDLANKLKPFFLRCAALPAPPAGTVKRER